MTKEGIEGYPKARKYDEASRWIELMSHALTDVNLGFSGFTVRPRLDEVLLVLKADSSEGKQVAFISGDTLGSVMRKAIGHARGGHLRWREDKYSGTNDEK